MITFLLDPPGEFRKELRGTVLPRKDDVVDVDGTLYKVTSVVFEYGGEPRTIHDEDKIVVYVEEIRGWWRNERPH